MSIKCASINNWRRQFVWAQLCVIRVWFGLSFSAFLGQALILFSKFLQRFVLLFCGQMSRLDSPDVRLLQETHNYKSLNFGHQSHETHFMHVRPMFSALPPYPQRLRTRKSETENRQLEETLRNSAEVESKGEENPETELSSVSIWCRGIQNWIWESLARNGSYVHTWLISPTILLRLFAMHDSGCDGPADSNYNSAFPFSQ